MEENLTLSKNINCSNRSIFNNLMPDQFEISIKNGNERSFELFFRINFVRLCYFANKFLNDPEESKEIVLDAFTKIWEGRDNINPKGSLKSYIFKITKNDCLNKLIQEKVKSRYVEFYKQVYGEHEDFSAQELLITKELEENIRTAVLKLPVECRKVFELSRIGGHKYREISDICHISVKTVEAQMSKALRLLRIELSEYLPLLLVISLLNCFV